MLYSCQDALCAFTVDELCRAITTSELITLRTAHIAYQESFTRTIA